MGQPLVIWISGVLVQSILFHFATRPQQGRSKKQRLLSTLCILYSFVSFVKTLMSDVSLYMSYASSQNAKTAYTCYVLTVFNSANTRALLSLGPKILTELGEVHINSMMQSLAILVLVQVVFLT